METNATQETLLDKWAGTVGSSTQQPDREKETESRPRMKIRLVKRFLHWLYPDKRRSDRHPEPPLVAYLGTVRLSQPFPVSDISSNGFYMLTTERWLPGIVIPMTLARTGTHGTDPADCIIVETKVVRSGPDGVGFAFVLPERATPENAVIHLEPPEDENSLARFLQSLNVPPREESQPEEAA